MHFRVAGAAAIARQAQGLLLELGARQRVAGIALGLVDACLQALPAARLEMHLADPARRVRGIDFGIELHGDARREGAHRGRLEGIEFSEAGAAVQGDQRQHGGHRELGLVHGARIGDRPEHVERCLMHMGDDPLDVAGGQAMLLHQLQQRVGGRMGVPARGVELERGLGQRPARAQTIVQASGVGVIGEARGHALRCRRRCGARR